MRELAVGQGLLGPEQFVRIQAALDEIAAGAADTEQRDRRDEKHIRIHWPSLPEAASTRLSMWPRVQDIPRVVAMRPTK